MSSLDYISEGRLASVHPKLAELVRQLADRLAAENIVIRVTQGLRTWDEQAELYAKGRTVEPIGAKYTVTNAPAGSSYHNFGLAVDVVPMTPLGPDWNETHPNWKRIIALGLEVGLTEGAGWRTRPDCPHLQLTGSLPVSPNEYVHAAYAEGGIQAVWTAAGLFVA